MPSSSTPNGLCPHNLVSFSIDAVPISSRWRIPIRRSLQNTVDDIDGSGVKGFLFDRRHMRENIYSRWGKVPRAGEGTITCVRRFGRDPALLDSRSRTRSPHVTGARLSRCNGHEVC